MYIAYRNAAMQCLGAVKAVLWIFVDVFLFITQQQFHLDLDVR